MSSHPIAMGSKKRSHEEKIAEQYVNFILIQAIPKAMTLSEVKCASMTDRKLQKAIEWTRNGKWYQLKKVQDPYIDTQELQVYCSIQDELVVHVKLFYSETIKL
jgi:hypothetical protein